MRSVATALSGHWWTLGPGTKALIRAPTTSASRPFRTEIDDPVAGRLALTGRLHEPAEASELAVVVHGLAGNCERGYARQFARRAAEAGLACLRLNLRGADHQAPDFYHAGLTEDLRAALAASELARYERVVLVGFSLGGHVALRWGAEAAAEPRRADRRVAAIATVCAPLDLDRGATALDAPRNWLYRTYLLRGMKTFADAVERVRPDAIATPRERRNRAATMREWDGLVVAPRWGFASAEDYYARASAGPRLAEIRLPTWMVLSEHDPMVPPETVRPSLAGVSASSEITWTSRGGHVGFPPDLDLGRGNSHGFGLDSQLLAWLTQV